ncbi:MAG: SRPBCC family protein [Bacteroidia bacterium]
MKRKIETQIVINAPAETVYRLLTQLDNYKNWNPFIIESKGKAVVGQRLVNVMRNGNGSIRFQPIVTRAEENTAFEWLGSLGIRGLFDGRHYFVIERIKDNQVNLIHGEYFSGVLSGWLLRKIDEQTRSNFIAMNQALRAEAERLVARS